MRAQYDLEVNLKSEREIEVILSHLEYQNELLITMMKKLGANVSNAVESDAKEAPVRRATPKSRAKTAKGT